MTAEEYAAAWLRELWRPVPEYHPGIDPRTISDRQPRKVSREQCHTCGRAYASSYMARHVRRAHQGRQAA